MLEYAQFSIPGDNFTDLIHVGISNIAQSLHIFYVLGNHGYANMSKTGDRILLFEIDNLALILGLAFGSRLDGLLERIDPRRLGAIVT